MGFKCGIVGLPNAGKSTIFKSLTAAGTEVAPYPFSTVQPHQGIAVVPDIRLSAIAELVQPTKTIPATLEVWDIAGLVKGASKGEGLGNQFLSHIRTVDALLHVVRCFEDENVAHEGGPVDPVRDIETIRTELLLADLDIVTRRINKIEKIARSGDKQAREELEVLNKIEEGLSRQGVPARRIDGIDQRAVRDLPLLTFKPVLYVANISEEALSGASEHREKVLQAASAEHARAVVICGKIEAELEELAEDERRDFLGEYGLERSGLEALAVEGYRLLNLITFYTTVSRELRAWTIVEGTKAPSAAGKIHTDMERGFIKAEVIGYEEFVAAGSLSAAREKGMIVVEGKDYTVRDGDIVTFKFNV